MLLVLLALAVLDSINPSAIVVTLYLLSRDRASAQVVVYVAAIFVIYLTLGATMMLGIDARAAVVEDRAPVRVAAQLNITCNRLRTTV
jgi:hypothetical protein